MTGRLIPRTPSKYQDGDHPWTRADRSSRSYAMGYFDTDEGVDEYQRMAEGYDGRALVDRLIELVPRGASVLELGIGPGKDLDMLREHYVATGSDSSTVFLRRYAARHPEVELLELDAVTLLGLEPDRRFDAVYSNKVLHHLTTEDLRRSLARQAQILRAGGIALHALWQGEGEQEHAGMRFVYYTTDRFAELLPTSLTLELAEPYAEMEAEDSLLVVLRAQTGS